MAFPTAKPHLARVRQKFGCLSVLLLLAASLPQIALAQPKGTIVGRVLEARTGEPLPGANVALKGTTMGAATTTEGFYIIRNVPAGTHTIVASFIGYHSQERTVTVAPNARTTADFSLKESVLQMDEIVVTGTGTGVKRKAITAAVGTISAKDIEGTPSQSIDQLLQGRVTGGVVNLNSGQPGTAGRIRVRGVNSATVSQTPVIYIDGVRVDNNDNFRLEVGTGGLASNALSDILVGDIERIEITKGGAASTLYGSEAANGVIQIFTKKGTAGPARWTFKLEQGFNSPEKKFIIEDFTKDEVLRTGYYQKYIVGLDGGSQNTTYHFSGSILGNDGVLPKNNDNRYSFRGGVRTFPNDQWQIDFSAGVVRDDFERMFNNNAIASLLTSVEGADAPFGDPNATLAEKEAAAKEFILPKITEAVNRFNFGTTARFEPSPFFTTRLTLGLDFRKNENRQFIPIAAQRVTSTPGGGLNRSDREFLTVTLDYAGTIRYPTEGDITSSFTFGAQGFRQNDRTSQVIATSFGLPGSDDFDNAANLSPQESNQEVFNGGFFFNEQLGFRDKFFVNAGIRFDGNTAFGDKVNLETYPKFGAAYNVSDERFWSKLPWGTVLHQLKLRGSWGETGSFPTPFTKDKSFNQGAFLGTVSANFGNPGDPDLGPERTRTIEFGLDAALLQERIGIEFTVFDEKTTDALFSVPSDPATGLGFQLRNVGTIENNGIELGLNATVIDNRDLKVSFRGSYSTLDNEVTSLGGSQPFSIGGFGFLPERVEKGRPVGVFRTNEPTGDGKFETVLQKSPIADKYYSLAAFVTFRRNFRLTILGDGQTGGYILNTGSVIRFFNGAAPQASKVPPGYSFVTASGVFVEDSNFFKIREITASYRVPQRYFGTALTLSASVRNLLTFANNDDLDPELNGVRSGRNVDVGGINFFTLSPPRQFRFTVEVGI